MSDLGAGFAQGAVQSIPGCVAEILEPRTKVQITGYVASSLTRFDNYIATAEATVHAQSIEGVESRRRAGHVPARARRSLMGRFVNLQVAIVAGGPTREGFGLDLILSHRANLHVDFHERARLYNETSDAVADGFAEGSPEVLALDALFSQTPRPPQVAIGRCESAVTQKYTISARAQRALSKYKLNVDGEGVTSQQVVYTSLASPTDEAIHAGLVTGLNAVPGANYLAALATLAPFSDPTFTADSSTDELHAVAHGLKNGDGPVRVSNSGGGLPTGLAAATDYWAIFVDVDNIKLATTQANAIAGVAINITTNGTGTQTLLHQATMFRPSDPFTVTALAVANWFSIGATDIGAINIAQTHADPGIAADLDAIALAIGQDAATDFYRVDTLYNSNAYVAAVAAWVEANGKTYIMDSQDSDSANTAYDPNSSTDTLAVLKIHAYKRTMPQYHPRPAAFLSASLNGILLPKNPGLWTAFFKSPVGPETVPLTPTQIANLEARSAGSFTREGSLNLTWNGAVPNASYGFFDNTVSIDWFLNALYTNLIAVMASKDKVAFDDKDIDDVAASARSVVLEGISDAHNMIAAGTPGDPLDPVPQVIWPKVRDIDPTTRTLRKLPNGTIKVRFLGAIQEIDGTVTVSF